METWTPSFKLSDGTAHAKSKTRWENSDIGASKSKVEIALNLLRIGNRR